MTLGRRGREIRRKLGAGGVFFIFASFDELLSVFSFNATLLGVRRSIRSS